MNTMITHELWIARDLDAFIHISIRVERTSHGIAPALPVAFRWLNLPTTNDCPSSAGKRLLGATRVQPRYSYQLQQPYLNYAQHYAERGLQLCEPMFNYERLL